MKTNVLNLKQAILPVAGLFILAACEKEDASFNPDAIINVEEIAQNAIIDVISDEVDNMVENVYYIDEQAILTGKSADVLKETEGMSYLSDCVIVTTSHTEVHVEKTLDFGAGCETANGNILRGMIHFSYENNMEADSNTISISFENFYFNDANIAGEREVVRVRENSNGNPQATITHQISVTWPDQSVVMREGTKVREWVEGIHNGIWADNVYLVTGNRTTTFPSGNVHEGETITPLRRELSCRFLVSGMLQLRRNDSGGILDFGNGSCDNEAVFTSGDGDSKIISLN